MICRTVIPKSATVCANSSMPYFAAVLHEWPDSVVYTHRLLRDQTISDGPYIAKDSEYSGFDFGISPSSWREIRIEQTDISFGAVNFSPKTHAPVISDHPSDSLIRSSDSPDSLLLTHGQFIQYFNGAHSARTYNVDMATDAEDQRRFMA